MLVSASGARIPNLGQKCVRFTTNEGKNATGLYQIADVHRPLTSVSSTCDKGNWVVYTSKGGFILNCETGDRTYFDRVGGIYELDLWVSREPDPGGFQGPAPTNVSQYEAGPNWGFHRQGY